jgi:hypothetical protein
MMSSMPLCRYKTEAEFAAAHPNVENDICSRPCAAIATRTADEAVIALASHACDPWRLELHHHVP